MSDFIEIKIDNQEVEGNLQEIAKKSSNLRPLMKNIAGIFASATEDNFAEEGRPDKWIDLSEVTKKQRKKIGKYPGQILQVSGQLASSVNTYYDEDSAIIGSNLAYAAIHQLGGQAGKNKKVTIPARLYLKLIDDDYQIIVNEIIEVICNTKDQAC
jgi:phage virion morphogenesis protein